MAVGLPCIVVDDGSDSESNQRLHKLLDEKPEYGTDQFRLIEHAHNQGKGAAVLSGVDHALNAGYSHVIQIDADGQHNVQDIELFLRYSQTHPEHIVSGAPIFDNSAPKSRVHGRKITNFWVAIETLSLGLKDSLCGFRIYPLKSFKHVIENYRLGTGMDFDTEILVKSVWAGVTIHFIPTKVIYPSNSVSHFNYLRDNFVLIGLHTRLVLGMLVRLPKLILWRISGRRAATTR
jgi:glycosyltransferase involved in cell wall biosynthesis